MPPEAGDENPGGWKARLWTLLSYLPMVAIVALIVLYWSLN